MLFVNFCRIIVINIYKGAQVRKSLYGFRIKILNLKIPLLIFTSFERSGTTKPAMHHHIAEDWSPLKETLTGVL